MHDIAGIHERHPRPQGRALVREGESVHVEGSATEAAAPAAADCRRPRHHDLAEHAIAGPHADKADGAVPVRSFALNGERRRIAERALGIPAKGLAILELRSRPHRHARCGANARAEFPVQRRIVDHDARLELDRPRIAGIGRLERQRAVALLHDLRHRAVAREGRSLARSRGEVVGQDPILEHAKGISPHGHAGHQQTPRHQDLVEDADRTIHTQHSVYGRKKLLFTTSGHSDIIITLGADSLEICDAVRSSEISSLCHDSNYSTTSPHRQNRHGGIVMFHRIMSMQPVE